MQRFPSSFAPSIASAAKAVSVLPVVLSLALVSTLFQGCMTDNRSGNTPAHVSDTSMVDEYGVRRAAAPKVVYRTHDSLVTLDILATERGDESSYWIIRNGKLLESPYFLDHESGVVRYRLVDTVKSAGTYVYFVQFGRQKSRLGLKSPEFTYIFPGHSRSGVVSLSEDDGQLIRVVFDNAPGEVTGQVRFERKSGSGGSVAALDTIGKSGDERLVWLDPELVPLDTVLYYRAVARDALTEKWLEPTSWDSIAVRNRTWSYIPIPIYENLGDEVRVRVRNPVVFRSAEAMYRLYRSETEDRDDGIVVDSLPMDGSVSFPELQDAPSGTGTWFYWLEASDPHGRTSPRSYPTETVLDGRPVGASIGDLQVYSTVVRIHPLTDPEATGFVLQRAPDTAGSAAAVDSVMDIAPNEYVNFLDIPPLDGYWYYRVITILPNSRSEPGEWKRSAYFRKETTFKLLTASLINRGEAGVETEMPTYSDARYYLYRSARADGSDSLAVDSAAGSPVGPTLRDKPAAGTWYYRVFRFDKPSGTAFSVYRSNLLPVDFTAKAVGPDIKRMRIFGTGIDLDLGNDPEAVAYVVERSFDTSGIWTVIDTASAGFLAEQTVSDHPPSSGHWSYRVRSLTRDFVLTDPGTAVRTQAVWSYHVQYDNQLQAVIANTGSRVECALTTSNEYGYYLYRSRTADFANAVAVDTALIDDPDSRLLDEPAQGIWYYWVERIVGARENLNAIYRSMPARVEFTGSPEIISLIIQGSGVRIAYPQAPSGDTLEIWRSAAEDDDSASFIRVSRDWGSYPTGTAYHLDHSLEGKPASFYRYRLAVVHGGVRQTAGPTKILYYRPD